MYCNSDRRDLTVTIQRGAGDYQRGHSFARFIKILICLSHYLFCSLARPDARKDINNGAQRETESLLLEM